MTRESILFLVRFRLAATALTALAIALELMLIPR